MEIERKTGSREVEFRSFPLGCFFEYYGEVYLKIRPTARECCDYNAYNCVRDDLEKFSYGARVIPLKAKVVIE